MFPSVTEASPTLAATNSTRNAVAVRPIPIAILTGVDGSRPLRSSHRQNATSGNVSRTTHAGLMAFEMIPVTRHAVFSFAQYVIVDPFWWNTIQTTITIRYTTTSAAMRLRVGTASIGC